MLIIACDMCGKLKRSQTLNYVRVNFSYSNRQSSDDVSLDLCPDCNNSLWKFIKTFHRPEVNIDAAPGVSE